MRRRTLVALATATAGGIATFSAPGRAQGAYPERPITLVVAAPAGGGTDLIARLYAEQLSRDLGQQVIVDNKGGGNGNIATALVARAKPDGYTLLMQYSAYHSANPRDDEGPELEPGGFRGRGDGRDRAAGHRHPEEGARRRPRGASSPTPRPIPAS